MAYADDVKRILSTMNDETDQVAMLAGMTREEIEAVGGVEDHDTSVMLAIYFTAEELDLVRRAAAAVGMTVSAYIRTTAVEVARETMNPAGAVVELSTARTYAEEVADVVGDVHDDPMGFLIPPELVPLFVAEDGKFTPNLWWWSFDMFFVGFIRIAAKKMREDGHGCPGSMTETEWTDYLLQIENDLAGYGVTSGWKKDDDTYLNAQRAIYRFADLLGAWWD